MTGPSPQPPTQPASPAAAIPESEAPAGGVGFGEPSCDDALVIDYRVLAFDRDIAAEGKYGIDVAMIWGTDVGSVRRHFPMLGHVLPYEDTRFNSSQVRVLAEELDQLPSDHPLPSDIRVDLRRLCDVVLANTHHQLWFIGD